MEKISDKIFGEERALYGSHGLILQNCSFDGEEDGESALKECTDIEVNDCFCNLRYPFWHDHNLKISNSEMTMYCRAALWYSDNITLLYTRLHGIKALRECSDVYMYGCDIISPEFGWSVNNITMNDCTASGEYFMMRSSNINFKKVHMKGKYSFQYIENAVFEDCVFDTKDAFWHGKNIIVRNSTVNGEYLAWYSDGITFENCTIIGTQPLCYCKNLRLINCEMVSTDLCFEKSDVEADIISHVDSIKNPHSGKIIVLSVGDIIMDDDNARGEVSIKK